MSMSFMPKEECESGKMKMQLFIAFRTLEFVAIDALGSLAERSMEKVIS